MKFSCHTDGKITLLVEGICGQGVEENYGRYESERASKMREERFKKRETLLFLLFVKYYCHDQVEDEMGETEMS